MKARGCVKKVLFQVIITSITLFGISSCNNNQTKDIHELTSNTISQEKDAQFLIKAAEINLEEIWLGQLAQEKSKMTDVKEFAEMIENNHSQFMSDLNTLAIKKQIIIPISPNDNAQIIYKKLNAMSGADFDKEYCELIISGHKNAISEFEKAAKESSDEDIKKWATTTLISLQSHLDHAITCQKKYNGVN